MPTGLPNLLDIAKIDAGDAYPIIEESVKLAPELQVVPADVITSTSMQLTVRTDIPAVAFRNLNEGSARSKSEYVTRTFETHILDHQVAVDIRLLDGARNPARVLQNHSIGVLQAQFRLVGTQFYYGGTAQSGADAKGFPGLLAQSATDAAHVIDATGSTAKTSVWMVRLGVETLQFLFGSNQTLAIQPDWLLQTVYDSNNNPYQALTNWLSGRVGLRLANRNSAVRIKNIGTDANKGLTDALLRQGKAAFQKFGWQPTHIFMNTASQYQLWQSRVTSLIPNPAWPTDFDGIPIVPTESIVSGETV